MRYFLAKYVSEEVRNMLIEIAEKRGLSVCSIFKGGVMHWDFVLNKQPDSNNDISGAGYSEGARGHVLVTPGEMFTMIMESTPKVTVRLTDDYNAVVDLSEKIITVGCQKIPFSKVEELYKVINK